MPDGAFVKKKRRLFVWVHQKIEVAAFAIRATHDRSEYAYFADTIALRDIVDCSLMPVLGFRCSHGRYVELRARPYRSAVQAVPGAAPWLTRRWSVRVNGTWRTTFFIEVGNAALRGYLDYH